MALSNIFREPRRELIEQTFGFGGLLGLLVIDLLIATALCRVIDGTIHVAVSEFCLVALFLAPAVMFVVFLASIAMHALGETICDAMANRGYDPRPKNRYL